jgi:hypothetical protein
MAHLVCPSAVCILAGTGWNGNETLPHASPATPCRRYQHTAEGQCPGPGNVVVVAVQHSLFVLVPFAS